MYRTDPISYRILGKGTPLLLIHGGFSDGPLTWGVQMHELADTHQMIVVDRRGHGQSPHQPRPYTIAGDAQDIIAVLSAAEIEECHMVGHSYGSLVALEIAVCRPELALSLHLVEPPYLSLLKDDPDVKPLIDRGTALFTRAANLNPEEIAAEFFTTLLGSQAMARLRTRPAWQALVKEAAAEAYCQFPDTFPAERACSLHLTVPVNVYCGEQSGPGMQKLARATVAHIKGAHLVTIAGAGHDLQRTPEFNEALTRVTCGVSKKTAPQPPAESGR